MLYLICPVPPLFKQVELLVMKALSLDLVRGSIDEIEQKCHMTWVQPRVLDRTQVQSLIYYEFESNIFRMLDKSVTLVHNVRGR